MGKTLNILSNSLRLTLQELKVNKLRTALSLTGVAFGIFCIIGVLATVDSLQRNIQTELKSLGTNTIYIERRQYGGDSPLPWWKIMQRPVMKYEEAALIKERSVLLDDISFLTATSAPITHLDDINPAATVYGIVAAQMTIQPIKFEDGRFFSQAEFNNAANICLIGFTNAESLFGTASRAVGKQIDVKGKRVTIVGVIKKEGTNFIGWDYDNCVMIPYKFYKQILDVKNANPIIIAKGKEGISTEALTDELEGIMRQIRKLSPTQEDNFSLNSVEAISKSVSGFFSVLNVVGGIIGGISLIVGLFGIANIMFVTVKERTSVIGLKKAIGAKSRSILFEFLLEAVILCLMGGTVGLFFVFVLTKISSKLLDFPIYISVPMLLITIIVCVTVGVISGIFPASRAARLDPVVAIRG